MNQVIILMKIAERKAMIYSFSKKLNYNKIYLESNYKWILTSTSSSSHLFKEETNVNS